MQNLKYLLGSVFLVIALFSQIYAQTEKTIIQDARADALFDRGVILYNNGDYAAAFEAFNRLIVDGVYHQKSSAALLMRAKTNYLLKSYRAAETDLNRLLKEFPNTKYKEHVQILAGLVLFQKQDVFRASQRFLWTVDFATTKRVRDKGVTISEILIRDYLSLEMLRRLQQVNFGADAKALITWGEARLLMADGDLAQAQRVVQNFRDLNASTRFDQKLGDLLQNQRFESLKHGRVGVVLPLSGEFAEEGKAVLRGVEYAEAESRAANGDSPKSEFVVVDSEGSMVNAVVGMQRLTRDPSIWSVIGELDAYVTAGLAGMAEASGTPFLAPVTADNGLASIGENVFQLTPDFETRARTMAKYAIETLGHSTFVTMAPQDVYGRQMVDAFSEEIDRLGGEILTQHWYYGVPENLGRQFKAIREVAFRKAHEDTIRYSIPNFAMINKDSLWRAFETRVMIENNLTGSLAELTSHFPVRNVDAIFLPVYSEDIKFVARQLTYYNIRAQILGGEKWYELDLAQERDLARYIENAVFVSGYLKDSDSFVYRRFRDEFRQRMRVTPEKWELLGYDAARIALEAMKSARSKDEMRNALTSKEGFSGVKGDIRFSAFNRVNASVHLVQIRGARYQKVVSTNE